MKIHRSILVSAGIVLFLGACGSDATTADTTPAPATTVATSPASAPPADSSAPATTAAGSTPAATTAGGEAPATGVTQTDVPQTEVKVSIGNFKFEPAAVTVATGGTITWTNDHNQPHTATASGTFDTGSLAPGESKTITFDKPGTFKYICSFHPFMTGTVVVV